jgi:hypothetical protein
MENCGGARVDWKAETSVTGLSGCDAVFPAETSWMSSVAAQRCGCAHCEVVAARQQSWLQQLVARIEICSDPSGVEPWHWWAAFRTQQACGETAVTASASGANVPTSANNSRNLAVKRCMISG